MTEMFVSNDKMAIGKYRAIREAGLKFPEDISVIGFDNIEVAKYLRPSLTTVKMDSMEMGSVTTNTIITSIEKDVDCHTNLTIETVLIIRD